MNWTDKKGSHPLSSMLRPIFEMKRIRAITGAFLASTSMITGMLAIAPSKELAQAINVAEEVQINTEKIVNNPLPAMTGISQGYLPWHPGIDITAKLGSDIYPVSAGVVEKVDNFSTGYGRHVIIRHNDQLESLYAHMGKIVVQEGDVVTTSTKIGEVGLTGHTTGPHLHLEIHKNGATINPLNFLMGR